MSVGGNIKKRRLELRMSQQELADAMGYKTRSTIAKIESGENDVSQKKMQRFAEILETTVEALISGYTSLYSFVTTEKEGGVDKKNRNVVIVLAGGKTGGNRQSIPSQFINIHGTPIIIYSMDAYQAHPLIDDIYVVCRKGWESIVKVYAEQYGITKLKGILPAGKSGIESLKNALDYVKKQYVAEDFVFIQEATRPLVSVETISKVLQACTEKGSATICHSMKDYVQFDISGSKASYIDRTATIALQSPEAHRLGVLVEVFEKAKQEDHTLTESCCTMLLYNLGYEINFVESNINNIKIVREEDIAALGALIQR